MKKKALSLAEPLPLPESDPPEWDSPLLWLPYQVFESQRAVNRAVQRFRCEAPPEEVQRFEAVERRVRQQGGWSHNDSEAWKVLMSLLLYDTYRTKGEQVALEQLPSLLKMDGRFFRAQWWVKALFEAWEQQGREGRQKIKRLLTGQQGKWVSPQKQARLYVRNLPFLREIERRLEDNGKQKIASLLQEVERKYEVLHHLRFQFSPQNPHRRTVPPSVKKKADKLTHQACTTMDEVTALRTLRARAHVRYNEVLRQVTAEQEKFGCTDDLSISAIRKLYEQYEEQCEARKRR